MSAPSRPLTADDIFAPRPRPVLVEPAIPDQPAWLDDVPLFGDTIARAEVKTRLDVPAGTKIPTSWRLIDDVEVMDLPDPEYLIDGILARRSLTCVYGPPGAGKTTILAEMAVAIATKGSFFGHEVRHRGAVVYAGSDDPFGWKPRLMAKKRAAGLAFDRALGIYLFPEPLNILDGTQVEAFIAFLASVDWPMPVEAVMVDTYAASTPGANENSSEDTTRAMVNAQRLRDGIGAAVILAHHTNAGGSRERGHSAMRGAADTMICLTTSDDIVKLECNKQRNGAPFTPLTLKLTELPEGGCVFRMAADVAPTRELTTIQRKVFDALRDNFSADGATKSEWQRVCSDVAERSFHRAAKVLQDHQMVRASGPRFVAVEAEP